MRMKMKRKTITILLSIALTLSLVLSGCAGTGENKPVSNVSKTLSASEKQVGEIRPQDDFYEYVNTKLLKEKNITEDIPTWGTSDEVTEETSKKMNQAMSEIMKKPENYPEGTTERAVANLYQTALDSKGREKAALGPLKPYLDAVNAADSIPAYLASVARIQKDLGKSSLIALELTPDAEDSSRYVLGMSEPALLYTKEELESPNAEKTLQSYMTDLLFAYGGKQDEAKRWSEKLLAFNKALAGASLSKKEADNVDNLKNVLTLKQIQTQIPNLDVSAFLKDSGQEGHKSWVVANPGILPVLNGYLVSENLDLLKQYTTVALLHEYAPFLNAKFSRANAVFQEQNSDDKELAWKAVESLADMDLGELYSKKYFSAEQKQSAEKLVRDILTAYKENIKKLDWMSDESRSGAIRKLDAMNIKIGFPDRYPQWSKKAAVKSPASGGSFIENAVRIHRLMAKAQRDKAFRPVDHSEWGMSPTAVNAYYDPAGNEIVFPAAMLQAPFYDAKASYAQNLGGIGAVIGHEITHAFDDMGSQYDEKGNLRSWWTDEDKLAFSKRAKKFVEYFGQYEGVPGFKVDGELTLGENIADLGGISAVASILGDDRQALREMFKNYAISWGGKYADEDIKEQLKNDEHSPDKVRVNAVLSSTEAFYLAFDVKPGDAMYVAPENRVHMY